ncbi:MAG: response regulator [Pseudomonadota bacterium]
MKPRVLVIEDNMPNRDLARYLLEANGYACDEAHDGETALQMVLTSRPDLVICDLQLPGIDGFEVLRGLRAQPGLLGVPVVAVTAYAMVGDRERILAAGFDGYIGKPIDPQRFVSEIAGYLRRGGMGPHTGHTTPAKTGKRILVVDDRAPNRELLANVLGYFGHTVVAAEDGASALEEIRRSLPDLVITDLLMPNMDGEDLCRQLRADPATYALPIIIHTASYRARQGRQIADRVGVQWVLPKPCEPADIISMVSEALGVEAPWAQVPMPAQEAVAGGAAADTAGEDPLASLHVRNERLTLLLENAMQIAAAQGKTLAAAGMGQDAQSLSQRLTSLVNLTLELSLERDPHKLTAALCRAAQDIMSARYVGICILADDGTLQQFQSRGLDMPTHTQVAAAIAACPATNRLMGPGREGRMLVAAKAGDFTGLPPAHPPLQNMIACRVATRGFSHGWIYAADRLGNESFTADDERLLMALAAHLATDLAGLQTLDDLDRRVAERTSELEMANRQLEAFSALVSHDLRSPLSSIAGFAGMLDRKYSVDLPAPAARYVGNIVRNVAIMNTLIDDLLNFARASSSAMKLEPTDLSVLVRECIGKFEDAIAQRGINVKAGPLPVCRIDQALMTQVLINLIGNAIKYTGKQAQPTVEIGARREAGEHVVFVRDNGAGFDMAAAARLFSPFERLHAPTEFEGSGMGLVLVKQVVNRHGGRVWAEAAPGEGAAFYFTLPAH